MLAIKKSHEAVVDHIVQAASRYPITPENIQYPNQSPHHIAFIFEQLHFSGHLRKLESGEYIRA